MGNDYVSRRRAELKAEMAWLGFCSFWAELGAAVDAKFWADVFAGKFNAIRAKYVKRGRKPGSKLAAA